MLDHMFYISMRLNVYFCLFVYYFNGIQISTVSSNFFVKMLNKTYSVNSVDFIILRLVVDGQRNNTGFRNINFSGTLLLS